MARVPMPELVTLEDQIRWTYEHHGRIEGNWETQFSWNDREAGRTYILTNRINALELRIGRIVGISATFGSAIGAAAILLAQKLLSS